MVAKFSTTQVKISSKKAFELSINSNVQQILYKFQDFKLFSNLYESWKSISFKVNINIKGKSRIIYIGRKLQRKLR
jgi:hypothetical protein